MCMFGMKPPTYVLLSAGSNLPSEKLPQCSEIDTEERERQLSTGCLMQMGERVEVPVPSLSCLRLDTATPVDKALSFLQGMLKVSIWQAPPLVQRIVLLSHLFTIVTGVVPSPVSTAPLVPGSPQSNDVICKALFQPTITWPARPGQPGGQLSRRHAWLTAHICSMQLLVTGIVQLTHSLTIWNTCICESRQAPVGALCGPARCHTRRHPQAGSSCHAHGCQASSGELLAGASAALR